MLQGFSRLCLQISCAAPDCYLETSGVKEDTNIYSLFSLLIPPSMAFHSGQSWAKYLQGIKDVANL